MHVYVIESLSQEVTYIHIYHGSFGIHLQVILANVSQILNKI